MDDKTRMQKIHELNRDIERTRKHLQRCKQRKQEKTLSNRAFILSILALIAAVLLIAKDANATPLGGWDTFPGSATGPVDCRPTQTTRCA